MGSTPGQIAVYLADRIYRTAAQAPGWTDETVARALLEQARAADKLSAKLVAALALAKVLEEAQDPRCPLCPEKTRLTKMKSGKYYSCCYGCSSQRPLCACGRRKVAIEENGAFLERCAQCMASPG